jgi:hypothetical protein
MGVGRLFLLFDGLKCPCWFINAKFTGVDPAKPLLFAPMYAVIT